MLKYTLLKRLRVVIVFISILISQFIYSQPVEQMVKVIVAPDHFDWKYTKGENVKFVISVLQNGNTVKNARIKYEIGPEKMDATKKDSMVIENGTITIDGGSLKDPGFLRCVATVTLNGKSHQSATPIFRIKNGLKNEASGLERSRASRDSRSR